LVASMDSDCDEIYLMPQNESDGKKLIIQDFLFHRSNNDFEASVSGDDFDLADQDFRMERYAATDKETLTIYKICSKESILESMRDETPERTSDNLPHSASMEQYFLKSDCVSTLERTGSLDLLSNSSGTLNKSTLTDYAFDTVRNMNLDSCSTSRLSLSIKSEIFEDTTNGGGSGGAGSEVPRIKSWNIEDFTLTPEESFSDEQLPLDAPSEEEPSKVVTDCASVQLAEPLELDHHNGTAEYTIVDLDEEPYLHDPTISEFTSEITKEFDLLFSRAETESLQAAAAAAEQPPLPPPLPSPLEGPSHLGDVLKLLSDLPTRYSMQMLEHINLDTDDISIPVPEETQQENGTVPTSATTVPSVPPSPPVMPKPASSSQNSSPPVDGAPEATGGSVSKADRLKKARSQSLGNLRNKTKCFPL
ncbi:AGAP008076-PA, partial [Anopheles gambiae str. PEST]